MASIFRNHALVNDTVFQQLMVWHMKGTRSIYHLTSDGFIESLPSMSLLESLGFSTKHIIQNVPSELIHFFPSKSSDK